jgi:hypothetical protein
MRVLNINNIVVNMRECLYPKEWESRNFLATVHALPFYGIWDLGNVIPGMVEDQKKTTHMSQQKPFEDALLGGNVKDHR